jgi:hypothetical protein
MIRNEKYSITVNAANFKHYSKWFTNLKVGQNLECDLNQLLPNSRAKIHVTCDLCSSEKELSYKDYNSYGYTDNEYLCRECKRKKNNRDKWGVDNVFQLPEVKNKIKKTTLSNLGVDNVSKSDIIKEKKKRTNQKKYGVDWPQQSVEIRNKTTKTLVDKWLVDNISKSDIIKQKKITDYYQKTGYDFSFLNPEVISKITQTTIKNWGVTYSLSSDVIKKKISETNLRVYGFDNPSKNSIVSAKISSNVTATLNKKTFENINGLVSIDSQSRLFTISCEKCCNDFEITWSLFYKRRETQTIICTKCNKIDKHQSGLEISLFNFINSLIQSDVEQNIKIDGKEVDILIRNKNLAIEFNGLWWHSELYKPRNYHLEKTQVCQNNGISLIHVWEDDWLYRNEIVKSMISNKLGVTTMRIPARKCTVKFIEDKSLVSDFLEGNHIQGKILYSHAVGLFYDGKLVSLMTFIKRKDKVELNRYCSLLNTVVIGGASKIFEFYKKFYIGEIYTFSDNSYSSGNVYQLLGFTKEYDLKPDYSYFDSGIRLHKFNFRKKKPTGPRIWDSGKVKYKILV